MIFSTIVVFLVQGAAHVVASETNNRSLEAKERQVEVALAGSANRLINELPCFDSVVSTGNSTSCDACLFPEVEAYLAANIGLYGSTVTLLGAGEGKAFCSPYVFRAADDEGTYSWKQTDSLMDPAYQIDEQEWLREPVDTKSPVWSDPYFDEGGGNIEMETYSVPLIVGGEVVGVATTDLPISSGARVALAGVGMLSALIHLL